MENKQQIETNVIKPRLSITEGGVDYRLISPDSVVQLDTAITEITGFMMNNHGMGKTDFEKDDLYAHTQMLWNKYASILRDVKLTFYLNRKQFRYVTELLRDKLEYDVNTIFLAIELTNMLGEWVNEGTAKDDLTIKGYESDATEITYMYHLIAKHKVKGLSENSYLFAQVLRKIGEVSKIINYYDTTAKNLSTEIQNWVASFEENTIAVEGEAVKPSKKKAKEEAA
jgi:hypothetical protein